MNRSQQPGRRKPTQEQGKGSTGRSPAARSTAVSPIANRVAKEEIVLGTSYSERKELEDLEELETESRFKCLIDRTNE